MKEEKIVEEFSIDFLLKWLLIICCLLVTVYIINSLPVGFFSKKKYSKSDLAKYYKVDKKTFNKWIVFWKITNGILADYIKRKQLSRTEAGFIIYRLGNPEIFPVLSKKEIIEDSNGSYKSLRESVRLYPEHFGICYEDFLRMKKFPPSIANKIKEQYG